MQVLSSPCTPASQNQGSSTPGEPDSCSCNGKHEFFSSCINITERFQLCHMWCLGENRVLCEWLTENMCSMNPISSSLLCAHHSTKPRVTQCSLSVRDMVASPVGKSWHDMNTTLGTSIFPGYVVGVSSAFSVHKESKDLSSHNTSFAGRSWPVEVGSLKADKVSVVWG